VASPGSRPRPGCSGSWCAGRGPRAAEAYGDEIALAKQESAAIEERLGAYDVSGGVMSGREAALTVELEDRIAVIDGALARTAREA
jgi:hypothetical protein